MEQENNLTVMAFQTEGCSCTLTLKEPGDWSAVTFYIHVLAEILKEPPHPPRSQHFGVRGGGREWCQALLTVEHWELG